MGWFVRGLLMHTHQWEAATFRFSRTFVLIALCCFGSFSAASARADGLTFVQLAPSYQIAGELTVVGNAVCSGLPCAETVSFSFDFGYFFFPQTNITPAFYRAYYSDLLANWSGALGSYTETLSGPYAFPAGSGNFLAFADAPGDEIDINLSVSEAASPVVPSFGGPELDLCATATCVTDFSSEPTATPPVFPLVAGGTAAFTVTPIASPEPSILSLLALALFALGLAAAWRKVVAPKVLAD
jgi:hypothetical protein